MTIKVKLGDSLSHAVRAHVGAWCDSRLPAEVEVTNREPLRTIDPGSVFGIIGALISTIMLLVQERRYQESLQRQKEWSVDRLLDAVAEFMVSQGVVDFEVISINNYNALKGVGNDPECRIEVRDRRSDERWRIKLTKENGAFLITT